MSLKDLKKIFESDSKPLSLAGIINTHLEKSNNRKYKAKPSIRPSSLGSPCLRKNYYSYFRVEPDFDFDADKLRIFRLGDAIHDMVKEFLRDAGFLIDYRNKTDGNIPKSRHTGKPDPEFPVKSEEYRIRSGKVDGVGIIEDQLWIYEFKSINAKGYASLKGPKESHAIQASLYLKLFEEGLIRGDYSHIPELNGRTEVAGVRYLYVNKDSAQIREFVATKKECNLKSIEEKINIIITKCDNKELPETTWDFCNTCEYRLKCKRDWNEI